MAKHIRDCVREHLPPDCASLVLAYLSPGANPFYLLTADRRVTGPITTEADTVRALDARARVLFRRLAEHLRNRPLRGPLGPYLRAQPRDIDQWLDAQPDASFYWRLAKEIVAHDRREHREPLDALRRLRGQLSRVALDRTERQRWHAEVARLCLQIGSERPLVRGRVTCRDLRARRALQEPELEEREPEDRRVAHAAFLVVALGYALWNLGGHVPHAERVLALLQPRWECQRSEWPHTYFAVHVPVFSAAQEAVVPRIEPFTLRVRDEVYPVQCLRLLMDDGSVSPELRWTALLRLAGQRTRECAESMGEQARAVVRVPGEMRRFDVTAMERWRASNTLRAPLHVWIPLLRRRFVAMPEDTEDALIELQRRPPPRTPLLDLRLWILSERCARLMGCTPERSRVPGTLGDWIARSECPHPLALLRYEDEHACIRSVVHVVATEFR